jgi:hypothetical protein
MDFSAVIHSDVVQLSRAVAGILGDEGTNPGSRFVCDVLKPGIEIKRALAALQVLKLKCLRNKTLLSLL